MDIQLSAVLFQLINFGVVLGVLYLLLYKPVLKIFAERAKRIEEGQRAASKAISSQEKIDELKAKTERELREKTAEVLKDATDDAKKQQEVIIAEAKKNADALIEKLENQFREEWAARVRSQEQSLVAGVYDITAKVLPKSLDAKKQSALIDDEIAKLIKQF